MAIASSWASSTKRTAFGQSLGFCSSIIWAASGIGSCFWFRLISGVRRKLVRVVAIRRMGSQLEDFSIAALRVGAENELVRYYVGAYAGRD